MPTGEIQALKLTPLSQEEQNPTAEMDPSLYQPSIMSTTASNIQDGSIEKAKKDADLRPTWSYATRKTVAKSMLNATLLLSNAADLKSLFDYNESIRDGFWIADLALLLSSISLQVALALVLMFLAFAKAETKPRYDRVVKMNNAATGIVLFITIINIIVTGFHLELNQKIK